MKYLFLLFCGLFSATCFAQSFKLEYRSPQMLIMVHDQQIIRIDTEFVYDAPASSVPSAANTKEKKIDITADQLAEIQRFVLRSGFINLEDNYGAKEYERFYPYTLEVSWQKIQKKVIFRSGQIADPRPQAFAELEKYVLEIAK